MEFEWSDPSVEAVWPAPPNEPRLRFLRSLAGPSDFRDEDSSGKFFRWLTGEEAQGPGLANPYAVAADGKGRVWVTDPGIGMVHVVDLARRRVEYIATAGREQLLSPQGVAYDPVNARLYVSDSLLGQVFVFDEQSRLVGSRVPKGGYGRPSGLATDAKGNLYVVDVLRAKVDVFSAEGEYLRALESASGRGFNRPSSVFVDSGGRVYVVDSFNFQVQILAPDGSGLGTIGQLGDVPGTLSRPRGVAVDPDGHIYVSDAAFDNVQVFDSAGRLLLFLGGRGDGAGQFNLPAGLFFDAGGRLYVVDTFNHRVQVFQYLALSDSEH